MQAKKTKRGYDASRRRASSDERRGRILQTARNLFGHYGYGATSIERIAGEAGVAVPTVYAMYRSKRAMLFALLDQADAQADVSGLLRDIGSIKEAWEAARLRAARILKGKAEKTDPNSETEPNEEIVPLACRFHDLRHTAVSRMLNAGVPIAKVAKIVGWSTSTMVLMAARYGHFSLNELRDAVESINGSEIEARSPVFSPVLVEGAKAKRPN